MNTPNAYYSETQYIPLVDTNGAVIGQGDRWYVHKKGILHKGFTITLQYRDCVLLQHRKHPVFDKVIDLTSSSHPLMINNAMEDEQESVIRCLNREWHIDYLESKNIHNQGSIVYKAADSAGFIEHEYCTFYAVQILKIPEVQLEYAYGYELVEKKYILKNPDLFRLAPWVTADIRLLEHHI